MAGAPAGSEGRSGSQGGQQELSSQTTSFTDQLALRSLQQVQGVIRQSLVGAADHGDIAGHRLPQGAGVVNLDIGAGDWRREEGMGLDGARHIYQSPKKQRECQGLRRGLLLCCLSRSLSR